MRNSLILLLALVTSCSTYAPNNDLNTTDKEPTIPLEVKDTRKEFVLSEQVANDGAIEANYLESEEVKVHDFSLFIRDQGYNSIYIVEFLNFLSKKDLYYSTIFCEGLSALVCSLWAKYKEPGKVKWKWFEFIKKTEASNYSLFSSEQDNNEFVNKEFGNVKMESFRAITFLFKEKSKLNSIVTDGYVAQPLLNTIQSHHLSQKEESTLLGKKRLIYRIKKLIILDLFQMKPKFNHPSSLLIQYNNKMKSFSERDYDETFSKEIKQFIESKESDIGRYLSFEKSS